MVDLVDQTQVQVVVVVVAAALISSVVCDTVDYSTKIPVMVQINQK